MGRILDSWKRWAHRLRRESLALYFACRDPRTPWYAKALAAVVVAYAFSPIDLIPDFIPVLGYLDDLVLVPLGIAIAVRLIPRDVLQRCRQLADERIESHPPKGWIAASVIVLVWVAALTAIGWWVFRAIRRR